MANYGVIRSWIKYWQTDLLEEPKNLLLGSEYLGNIVPEVRDALEKWQRERAGKNVQKNSQSPGQQTLVRLLKLLEKAVREDPVADLVTLECPDEMKDLKRLLSVKQTYTVARIHLILRRIEGLPSLQTLKEVLLRELSKGEQADRSLMRAVTVEIGSSSSGGSIPLLITCASEMRPSRRVLALCL